MRPWSLRRFRPMAFGLTVLVGLILALPAANAAQRSQHRNYHHQIELMEDLWRNAMLQHNAAALESLLADDFSAITADGAIQTRAELLANINSGTLNLSSLLLSERKVRIYGATAVVTSVAEVTGNRGENEVTGRYRYTRVYIHNAQGQWKIVSFEASRIQDPGERK